MKMVAGLILITLSNTVVQTHYLSSFWRFLWSVAKCNMQLKSHCTILIFAVLLLQIKQLSTPSFYFSFINNFLPEEDWFASPPQACLIAVNRAKSYLSVMLHTIQLKTGNNKWSLSIYTYHLFTTTASYGGRWYLPSIIHCARY